MHIMESAPGAKAVIDGKEVDYFCGCGYFGFQGRQDLIQAACQATCKYGLGSATSRQGYGNNPALLQVEKNAASFFGTEQALYYVSGYLGNSILLQGLSDDYDIIFIDRESHYSVFDGTAVANKPVVSFNHRDADDLGIKLQKHLEPSQKPLVISDGVFAVSGQLAPIPDYLQVLEPYDHFIICVDDAHAIGVIGKNGHGCFEHYGLSNSRLFSSGTLSKALGGFGAYVCGSQDLIGYLMNKSRAFIYTTSLPPAIAAANIKAIDIVEQSAGLRLSLKENTELFRNRLNDLGFNTLNSQTPIIPLLTKDPKLTMDFSQMLFDAGIFAQGIRPPTVPQGKSRIRITIMATHTREDLEFALSNIERIAKELCLI